MLQCRQSRPGVLAVAVVLLVSATAGCAAATRPGEAADGYEAGVSLPDADRGDDPGDDQDYDAGEPPELHLAASVEAAPACKGLQCDVVPGCTTTVSGTVYDPAGVNPLYNVVVFVPNDPGGRLPPIADGTSACSTCDVSIGDYVAATTSRPDGTFTLAGVPATTNVPLVVQIGKWRREVILPQVTACADNPISDPSLTRLPARRTEGHIPRMAVVTGGADNLGCFLEGIGLDPGEYSAPHGGGRLDVYQGLGGIWGAPGLSTGASAGDCTSDGAGCVWSSKANLEAYDIVLLACEGDTYDPDESGEAVTNKTSSSKQALHDWLSEGGRVFATHFHYTWFKNSPEADFQNAAEWLGPSSGEDSALYDIDTTFAKGAVFGQWLASVGALTGGQISLSEVAESVGAVYAPAQRWIYNAGADPQGGATNSTKYLSLLTPVGGIPTSALDAGGASPQYCGKAVFSDLHAGGDPAGDIPAACAGPPLSPQLQALEFLFFDLSACVSNDTLAPPPPPPPTM